MLSAANNSSVSLRDSETSATIKNLTIVLVGLCINYLNWTLIYTFSKHQVLSLSPRHILFIHLLLNDTIQLNTSISLFVLSYAVQRVHAICCLLILALALPTTFITPLNLAAMSVECYMAVCFPLRHSVLCTVKRTYTFMGCVWSLSAVLFLSDVFLSGVTDGAHLLHATVTCGRKSVFRHPVSAKKKEVSYMVSMVVVWLTILYSYFNIIHAVRVAKEKRSSTGDAAKARNTILLHGLQLLLNIMSYPYSQITRSLMAWFPRYVPHVMFLSYMLVHILPRFFSPLVYGLRDQTIRRYLRRYIPCAPREQSRGKETKAAANRDSCG